MNLLTEAWMPAAQRVRHPELMRLWSSPARIKVVAGGRRSGKTTVGSEAIFTGHGPITNDGLPSHRGALCPPDVPDPTFVIAAPTREMVKRIWWRRVKSMVPSMLIDSVSEVELTLHLVNGARVMLLGMDRPTRSEGIAIDGFVGDEFAYWKAGAFERSLRPAMSTRGRPGWGVIMFKPDGRNHAFDLWSAAQEGLPDHAAFHWTSAEVLPPEEVEAARQTLDPRSFSQEYEASFLTATGLCCYTFDRDKHLGDVRYDAAMPLVFAFDFNVAPGSAVVLQEQNGKTCVVAEVYIPDDSRSDLVCDKLRAMFPDHRGDVLIYGDPAGNQRRTSSQSNDWDIVKAELRKTFPRILDRVARCAPAVVDSVNSVNARMLSASGDVRFAINPKAAPQTLRDLESVAWDDEKGERQIDKSDLKRGHWYDALRYYIHEKHPIGGAKMTSL